MHPRSAILLFIIFEPSNCRKNIFFPWISSQSIVLVIFFSELRLVQIAILNLFRQPRNYFRVFRASEKKKDAISRNLRETIVGQCSVYPRRAERYTIDRYRWRTKSTLHD